jgi:5,10-methylene-tetrahydrofolate dehydrogenase/methenyl tetrahydrofolate cyclohydrolase
MQRQAGSKAKANLSTARRLLPPTPTDSKGVAALVGKGGARSRLATALVCADPASQVYMRSARAGWRPRSAWRTFGHRLSEQVSKAKLLALIASLAPMRV